MQRCYLFLVEALKYKIICILAVFISSLVLGSFVETVEAADIDLARQYAPILYFEKDETCFPVDVSYHIDNSYLYLVGNMNPIDMAPTAESIAEYTEDTYYLDNQRGSVDDEGIINDYQSNLNSLGYTVYSRVYYDVGTTVIQYWMFYAFNKGTQNQHEGDWEMVQIVLSDGTPSEVMYSQHHSGQKATWEQVEKTGDHIKVYVSRGSHANYLRSYSGVIGIANDLVGANGKILSADDYTLEILTNQSWLGFSGRWGWYGTTENEAAEASLLGQAGPPGPQFREDGAIWDTPIGWGNGLIAADDNLFLLELFFYNFITIFIILTIVTLGILLYRIYRRHKKTGLGPRIISILYIDGFNKKSIGNILCIVGIIIAIFALIHPWYVVSTDVRVSGYETHGMADMMTIDGINGIQIQVPGLTGSMPMGSFMVPFSLLIGISLVFLIIAAIGIAHSKKLGRKYLFRGIRLFIPVVFIVIIIMALGMIPFESMADTGDSGVDVGEVIGAISASPSGGQTTVALPEIDGEIELQWGFGLGGILLLVSGIILLISGFLEIFANTEFFAVPTSDKPKKEKAKKAKKQPKEEKVPAEEISEKEEKPPKDE
jgi:hypothetical protein